MLEQTIERWFEEATLQDLFWTGTVALQSPACLVSR